ncbi:MAG: M48 family metalloprotease [Okeania sp. SIO2D1]|nr:M48 family metalloprotease [Okeania sp. SIO2D1]
MSPFLKSRHRWLYGMLAGVTACSLSVATPQPSQAGLLDLIFRGIQIIQLSNMSDSQEVKLGKQINKQITRQVPVSRNEELNAYINELGQNLALTSSRPPDKDFEYTIQVVEDDSINAFATMGGFVYIHTGLIEAAENEAELVSVISHEIAHVAASHALNQMKDVAIQQGILSAAGLDNSQAVQIGVQLALNLPNSREDEEEADLLGLENMMKAGYDPIGAVTFMQTLQSLGGSSTPEILSTHPHTANRVKKLEEYRLEKLKMYQQEQGVAYQGKGLDSAAYKNKIKSLGLEPRKK